MLQSLRRYIRSRKGETLVEAMVSILIFTLSSIILFTMISAATNINRSVKAADATRQTQLEIAEASAASSEHCKDGMVTVVSGGDTERISVKVAQQKGVSDAFFTYFVE